MPAHLTFDLCGIQPVLNGNHCILLARVQDTEQGPITEIIAIIKILGGSLNMMRVEDGRLLSNWVLQAECRKS